MASVYEEADRSTTCAEMPLKKLFVQSSMVTAGNPKAIIFFTAIFPQFIRPGAGVVVQCSLMPALLALVAFVCFMMYAAGGERIIVLSRSSAGKWLGWIIGTSFIGAGIGLVTSS
jgi:threonine/homoserine/homoserine lactone efflux protein